MKFNVPELQNVADEIASVRAHGVRVDAVRVDVVHCASPYTWGAVVYLGAALFALAGAIIYAADGSKVAAYKGGRRGR